MKKFFSDFKAFALKGNIVDMAVGVIIGGAFGKIVTSLVNDIITPLISILTGKVMLTNLKWVISPAVLDESGKVIHEEVSLLYGNFLQSVIDFFIIALSIFIVIRIMMNAQKKMEALKKKKEEETEPQVPAETELEVLKEIRELMKKEDKQ